MDNPEKMSCADAVSKAARLIRATGRQVFSDDETERLANIQAQVFPDAITLTKQTDLLLVFGGDGTMLRVAREIAGSQTPILGINIGGLGFLTAVPSANLPKALKCVWNGQFKFESRVLIQATGHCGGQPVNQTALNDIVINRGLAS